MEKRLFLLLLLPFCIRAFSQEIEIYRLRNDSSTIIYGTSNVSDWTIVPHAVKGELQIEKTSPQLEIKKVILNYTVKEMKSGRSSIMDGKIYDALKSEEHPLVEFSSSYIKIDATTYTIQVTGKTSMAGISKMQTITLKYKKRGADELYFSGEHKLNMKDFNIEPPTAMFGALSCAPGVTLKFSMEYTKKEP